MDNTILEILAERLVQFGLTRQEANIYLCLLQNKDLSGYEVSKITGISRSNVYGALASLVEKGAAYLLAGETNRSHDRRILREPDPASERIEAGTFGADPADPGQLRGLYHDQQPQAYYG